MNILIRGLLFILAINIINPVLSQEVGIGEWRDLLPYDVTIGIEEVGDGSQVYCATPYSMFYYDKNDNSINRLSKVNGLSDIGISSIGYNSQVGILVVAYTNTNLDLISGNTIVNIPDIKRKEILGNKTINSVMNYGDYAYLSCGFGIVVVDLVREEIKDTYYIGPDGGSINVYDMAYNDTAFFAATEEGIYYADINNPNLAYFANWDKLNTLPSINASYNLVHVYNDFLFANEYDEDNPEDKLIYYDGGSWIDFDTSLHSRTNSLRNSASDLIISFSYFMQRYDQGLNMTFKLWNINDISPTPSDAFLSEDGNYWLADQRQGMVKAWENGHNNDVIKPSGAPTADAYAMSSAQDDLWLVPGGMSQTWANIWKGARVHSFLEEDWTTYDLWNTEGLDTIRDMVCVAVDPENTSRVFAGSWSRGAIEFLNNQLVNFYYTDNSSLQYHELEGAPMVKVGGIAYDSDNNVWFSNSGAENLLSVRREDMTSDGEWQSYSLGSSSIGTYVRELIIDLYDQKWVLARVSTDNPYYVFVFDETLPSGSNTRRLKSGTGSGNLPGNGVFSIAVDKEGDVWCGTDEGIAVFYNPEDVITNQNSDAQRILVDFDGYVQYLLETETVKAIAVDGANRKWIGTERAGLFLLSEDGTEQIQHFTEDNSPLLSNSIISLSINGKTGEVYIGTAKGIIGYKSDATEPNDNNDSVYAYPNPVKPGYEGPIAINGVVQNASVKITDINGNLVYETIAEGGQATWNGYDFNGRRANSGVYLVFISNSDGSETIVTKIVFMN